MKNLKTFILIFVLLFTLPFIYAENDGEPCTTDYNCGKITCSSRLTIEYPTCDIGLGILVGVPGKCTTKYETCPPNTACNNGACVEKTNNCELLDKRGKYGSEKECQGVCTGENFCTLDFEIKENKINECWKCEPQSYISRNNTQFYCPVGYYNSQKNCNLKCLSPPCRLFSNRTFGKIADDDFFKETNLECWECPGVNETVSIIEDFKTMCPSGYTDYGTCYQACSKEGIGECKQSKENKNCYSCGKFCPLESYNDYQSCYESCTKASNGQSYCKPSKQNLGCYSCEKFNQGVLISSDNYKVSCQGQIDNYLGKISVGDDMELPLNIHFAPEKFGIKIGDYKVSGIDQGHFYLDGYSIKLNDVDTKNNVGTIKIKSFNNLWTDIRNACPNKVAMISAASKYVEIKYNPPKRINQILPGILIDKKTQIGLLLPQFINIDNNVKIISVNGHKNSAALLSFNPLNGLGSLSSNLLTIGLQSNPRQATQARSYVMGQAFSSFTFGLSGTLEANV